MCGFLLNEVFEEMILDETVGGHIGHSREAQLPQDFRLKSNNQLKGNVSQKLRPMLLYIIQKLSL